MERYKGRGATQRSSFAQSKPRKTACHTSGSTAAASTKRAAATFQRPSTKCFATTRMRPNATSITPTFRSAHLPRPLRLHGCRHLKTAGGSLEAGRFRSSLLHDQSSSSRENGSVLEIRSPWRNISTRSPVSPLQHCKGVLCLNSASMSECHGQKTDTPRSKRTKPTASSACSIFTWH